MKKETTFRTPKFELLLFILMIFTSYSFSQQGEFFAQNDCGSIVGVQFSNGYESIGIVDGSQYDINDLPSNFYIQLNVEGNSESARISVENVLTEERVAIVDNDGIYTFPSDNSQWEMGSGTFKLKASIRLLDNGRGRNCDRVMMTFTLTNNCEADAGTITAYMDSVVLANGMATISATPDGNSNVPMGYETIFVLTQGSELVIVNAGGEPSFEVSEADDYTIHTLVYNPETLDLSIVELGVTTGVDVLNLINANGICASLDVAGAPIMVMDEAECVADAGTITADMDSAYLVNGMATVSATPDGNSNVPMGYETIFVLTQGSELVIVNAGTEPSFEVSEADDYTIHTLVYNPETLDLSIVELGVTTGVDVLNLINANGICASLDVAGAPIMVMDEAECVADAGTITADMDSAYLVNGMATVSATPDGNSNVPMGYETIFVLTQGSELVIVNAGAEPSFEVSEAGDYTIHTLIYNPATLDLGIVELGVTTGVDVLNLINDNGICASLDVAGAPIMVMSCESDSGTMIADSDTACLVDGMAIISATANGDSNVPDGYQTVYVLTQGSGLVIMNAGAEPNFEVTEGGDYTIHSLVYNPDTLDLGIVVPGETTGFDVYGLIIAGGGDICASLDVAGAPISVEDPNAGTMTADMDSVELVNGMATITATANGDSNVPEGYTTVYVLTQGSGLVIMNAGASPSFDVTEAGDYIIHSLVYNPDTLDLGIVVPGQTTGFDVYGLITEGGGDICASLDVAGAPIMVVESEECTAYAGTMYSNNPINCLDNGAATIDAMQNEMANIPAGYEQLFVLTEAFSLTILNVSATPEFTVNDRGFYRIHSLVYNAETLDLSVVVPGETTGIDVVNLINDNGICASLDVQGAVNLVLGYNWFCNFFNNYYNKVGEDNTNQLETYVKGYDSYKSFEKDFVLENSEISLYPNPVVSNLNVKIQVFDDEVMSYRISDVSGRLVMSGLNMNLNNESVSIDVNNLENGMYIISFESNYRTLIKKIIVNK